MIARVKWEDWERLSRIGEVADKGRGRRPILEAIYIEAEVDAGRVRATATDSYKLATVSVVAEIEDDEPPLLVPARAVRTMTKTFRQLASIGLGSKWATLLPDETHVSIISNPGSPRPHVYVEFAIGARYVGSLTADLVEGSFPSYRKLLHKPGAELARSTLARKRKAEISDYIAVQYGRTYDPEQNSKETLLNIADDFAAKPTGRAIGLNQDHLNDLMRTTSTRYPEYLKIEMFGETRPVFVSNPSDHDWQGIQMPVRI